MEKQNKKSNGWLGISIAIIFYIFIIIDICAISTDNKTNTEKQQNTTNTTKQKEIKQETTTNIIMSNSYHNYILDTLNKVNNDNIFNIITSRSRSQYIEIDIQSKERLAYNDYCTYSKQLTDKLYEQIKDKTIKKDGLLSNDDYIINLHFYKRFNDNINLKKKRAIQVGIYQIHTEDLEKYRDYDKCVNGGISQLEWQQE